MAAVVLLLAGIGACGALEWTSPGGLSYAVAEEGCWVHRDRLPLWGNASLADCTHACAPNLTHACAPVQVRFLTDVFECCRLRPEFLAGVSAGAVALLTGVPALVWWLTYYFFCCCYADDDGSSRSPPPPPLPNPDLLPISQLGPPSVAAPAVPVAPAQTFPQ